MNTHPRPPHRRPHPRGFSLIEMLVVLIVVGALVGIAMPVLQSMRKAGESSRARGTLAGLIAVADEYAVQTGSVVDYMQTTTRPVSGVNVGGANDNTIGFFLETIRQNESTLNLAKAASGSSEAVYIALPADVSPATARIDANFVNDVWGNKIRYAPKVSYDDAFNDDNYLPEHPRPFFVSAGPDGEFGDARASASAANREAAADNLYSFEME